MTSKQQLLDDLMGVRAQLADDEWSPCRVFVEDMIWSVREAISFEREGHPVAGWCRQLGLRVGDSRELH
jgi:hypothetical protein